MGDEEMQLYGTIEDQREMEADACIVALLHHFSDYPGLTRIERHEDWLLIRAGVPECELRVHVTVTITGPDDAA